MDDDKNNPFSGFDNTRPLFVQNVPGGTIRLLTRDIIADGREDLKTQKIENEAQAVEYLHNWEGQKKEVWANVFGGILGGAAGAFAGSGIASIPLGIAGATAGAKWAGSEIKEFYEESNIKQRIRDHEAKNLKENPLTPTQKLMAFPDTEAFENTLASLPQNLMPPVLPLPEKSEPTDIYDKPDDPMNARKGSEGHMYHAYTDAHKGTKAETRFYAESSAIVKSVTPAKYADLFGPMAEINIKHEGMSYMLKLEYDTSGLPTLNAYSHDGMSISDTPISYDQFMAELKNSDFGKANPGYADKIDAYKGQVETYNKDLLMEYTQSQAKAAVKETYPSQDMVGQEVALAHTSPASGKDKSAQIT